MIYKDNKGFTLIEVILTIAILSIIIVPLSSMFIQSAKINSKAELEYDAVELAQRYMEQIKALDKYDASIYGALDDEHGVDWFAPEVDTAPFKVNVKINPYTTLQENENKIVQINSSINTYDLYIQEYTEGYIGIKTSENSIVLDNIPINWANDTEIYLEFYNEGEDIKLKARSCGLENICNITYSTAQDIEVLLASDMTVIVNNLLDNEVKFDIKSEIDSKLNFNLQVLNGKVSKKTNILPSPIEKTSNYILYKILIDVYYKDVTFKNKVVSIEGYKIFDK